MGILDNKKAYFELKENNKIVDILIATQNNNIS